LICVCRLVGGDGVKHDSGESEDDYNDADWSLYPDKKSMILRFTH